MTAIMQASTSVSMSDTMVIHPITITPISSNAPIGLYAVVNKITVNTTVSNRQQMVTPAATSAGAVSLVHLHASMPVGC